MLLMGVYATLWALVENIGGGILTRYSAYQVVFTRYVVHIALVFVIWGIREPFSVVKTHRPFYQFARSLLMVGMPVSFVLAYSHGIDSGTLNSVLWLTPFLVLGLSSLFLHERPSAAVWATCGLAYCALFLFTGVPSRVSVSTLFFAFGMAATLSAYVVMTRSLRSESTRANLFYTAFGVALCLLPFIPKLWVTPSLGDFMVMAIIGAVGFVALYALDRATAGAPTSVTAPFLFLQLPTSMFLGRLLGYVQFGVKGLMATVILGLCGLYVWTREGTAPV